MKTITTAKQLRETLLGTVERGLKLSEEVLSERSGVDREHAHDIFSTAVMDDPGIVIVLGALNDEGAKNYLRSYFMSLGNTDPQLFEVAPSVAEFARLDCRVTQGVGWGQLSGDHKAYYTNNSELARPAGRRRGAYDYLQRLPTTEETAPDGYDAAQAAAMIGAGR